MDPKSRAELINRVQDHLSTENLYYGHTLMYPGGAYYTKQALNVLKQPINDFTPMPLATLITIGHKPFVGSLEALEWLELMANKPFHW